MRGRAGPADSLCPLCGLAGPAVCVSRSDHRTPNPPGEDGQRQRAGTTAGSSAARKDSVMVSSISAG